MFGLKPISNVINPGGPIWLPYVILIIEIEQGAKLELTNSTNLALTMLLKPRVGTYCTVEQHPGYSASEPCSSLKQFPHLSNNSLEAQRYGKVPTGPAQSSAGANTYPDS